MEDEVMGLGNEPTSKWPKVEIDGEKRPIEAMRPGSSLHARVLQYALDRLRMSEEEMQQFYSRWRVQEKKVQAYINLPNWEKVLKAMNDSGEPPKAVQIVVPHTYATISTIVTYLMHTFGGRKPMFQVGSYKKETVQAAAMMEIVLQYNADHTRLMKHLFQYFQDGEMYGVQILRTRWNKEEKMRTVWRKPGQGGILAMMGLGGKKTKTRERRVTYEGNDICSVDPFLFFPDPRVPMCEVNRRGEFVMWRAFEGKHTIKKMEKDGKFMWVDAAGEAPVANTTESESARNLLSGGQGQAGNPLGAHQVRNFLQIDQGSFEIIPAELGIGESTDIEKWIITIANKRQIIGLEKMDADHDMHPVVVGEPYSLGYGFGQPGGSDFFGPMQDTLSWLVNSHITNVRTALNNMLVVDPSRVEMQDLKEPGPGKLIRLKSSAMGQDVRSVVSQLAIADVTAAHMARDFPTFMRIADAISSVTDNLRGLQDHGGRKTATEVRTSGEAGASRLASHAKLISSMGIVDLTEQMALNTQQYLSDDFYLDIVGRQGFEKPLRVLGIKPDAETGSIRIAPEMIVGDFYFPVHDGTLPLDRVALVDVWKEIFMIVAQAPELQQKFSLTGIFEFVAELSGAKNLQDFEVDLAAQPDETVAAGAQQGNLVPIGGQGQ